VWAFPLNCQLSTSVAPSIAMPSPQNAKTKSSPVRDAPESAEKPKPKGFEPARPKVRPAPKSSATSRKKKKRARGAAVRAATKNARPFSASPDYKPVRLAEALREQGIDERKIAEGYASLHDKLIDSDDKGDLKLLVDVLEKNTRTLDPPRPPDRAADEHAPVTVILKHCIPRPKR
jgi:hypothetical protein